MEMRNVKVSVVVPVYNVQEYLSECIESIIQQTYQNYELILVDDGATDKSGEICEQYANVDARIKVIHKINGGLSSARNAGIDIAVGQYIVFIDSDDVVHPEYLSVMLDLAESQKADLVACNFVKSTSCRWEEDDDCLDIRCGKEVLERMNENDVVVTVAWNKLYERKLFCDTGLRYPEGKIHEDMFLTPQILTHVKKMVITNRKLYFYRQRPNSIMTEKFSPRRLDALEAIEFRIDFFEKKGYPKLVRREYEAYVRKSRQLFKIMKNDSAITYRKEMKFVYKKAMKLLFNVKIFRKLSLKYKVKLIGFLVLHN